MSVFLLDGGVEAGILDEIERKHKPAIPQIRRVADLEEVGKPLMKGGGRSFVILVASSTDEAFAKLLDKVNRHRNSTFFIAVGGEISGRDYKQLIQSGNADWVAESGLPNEVLDIIRRVEASASETASADQPIVVSFVPSAGGVGNSTPRSKRPFNFSSGTGAAG